MCWLMFYLKADNLVGWAISWLILAAHGNRDGVLFVTVSMA